MEHYEGDNRELISLNEEVVKDSDSYDAWQKLVTHAESLEGGISRNSSPQSIAAIREIYDRFLAKFPLFFGYWKKYADLEFAIAGTEAAELVYERGVASISNSVDLWSQYCGFKGDTSHDPDVIRDLFERGAACVGLDFLAHPFWDKFLEFEERVEATERVFTLLGRIVQIPMHQFARYFDRFRQQVYQRPLQESMPSDTFAQLKAETEMECSRDGKTEADVPNELRRKVDEHHMQTFQRISQETTKRWGYESEIRRPYFHVTELDDSQLETWRKYLDFEESEGDYARTAFLYERCLVASAYYEEFWLRYARWMLRQPGKAEEVRNIYSRASCIYAPISRPTVRLQWALFEEMQGRKDVAQAVYEAILLALPGHIETTVAWANCKRRLEGLDAAVSFYKSRLELDEYKHDEKPYLLAEWASLLWKVKLAPEEAREVFTSHKDAYPGSKIFWSAYLQFEAEQLVVDQAAQQARVKEVYRTVAMRASVERDVVRELARVYMAYLLQRGRGDAAKEYLEIDQEMNK